MTVLGGLIRGSSKKNSRKFSHLSSVGGGMLDAVVDHLKLPSCDTELWILETGLQAWHLQHSSLFSMCKFMFCSFELAT